MSLLKIICPFQEILWREDWDLLCLAWVLHSDAPPGRRGGGGLLPLWIPQSELYMEVTAVYSLYRAGEGIRRDIIVRVSGCLGNRRPRTEHLLGDRPLVLSIVMR